MKIYIQRPFMEYGHNAKSTNYKENSYGLWGIVEYADSETCTVDVIFDGGMSVSGIPVASAEWVRLDKDNYDYISGERNLPPKGSRVFVMMPTGTIESGFVLCSMLSVVEPSLRDAFMAKDKHNERYSVTPGNWKKTFDYENGSISIVSDDGKTQVNLSMDTSEGKKRSLKLSAFDESTVKIIEGESAEINIFGTKLSIQKSSAGETVSLSFSGDLSIESSGSIDITSGGGKPVKINSNLEVSP